MKPPSGGTAQVSVMTIVVSTAAIGSDSFAKIEIWWWQYSHLLFEGLGGEKIMEYVEAMCKMHSNLVLGYDWENSSSVCALNDRNEN